MTALGLVFIGGGCGAVLRYLSGILLGSMFGSGFPFGTLIVNVTGSFLMGIFVVWLSSRSALAADLKLLIATGFLGGFTTFSAFSLDFLELWERGQQTGALVYAGSSVLFSLFAIGLALFLARLIIS